MPFLFFIGALCFFPFAYGAIVVRFHVFPFSVLDRGFDELRQQVIDPPSKNFWRPVQYAEKPPGARIYDLEQIMPGATLITTFWPETDWSAGIRLIDVNGKTLNHWEIRPQDIWPESPHDDFAKNTKNIDENYVHGTYLYPDGDIVFNVEYLGLVRMNSCGDILWKLPYRTHHSVERDDTGNFWVSGTKWIESGDERAADFPGIGLPFTEDTMLEVSPEGEILREISLLESVYNGGYKHLFWHYKARGGIGLGKGDVIHLNDVEVLSDELADQFPLFEAGDILVSSRQLSLIAVLGQDGEIKWLSTGDFTNQHDPDFEENGWITVFDNRTDIPSPGLDDRASQIRSINPASGEIRDLYPADGNGQFYTSLAGKHQKLANGNRLITEAGAGRVFEISPEGETVWEWISESVVIANEGLVPEVLEGTRYDIDAQQVATWQCSGPP
ncbi:MAG: aryl-sulfate sulfotransferase [Chloroflexi bacterium]|nr:aryl-sulfate sulfotransferase [Chloroflexota bacterium]